MHQQGVAVVQVSLTELGIPRRIELLQAPSRQIGLSVIEAVKHWRFVKTVDPQTGERAWFSGALTFYFVIKDKQGLVLYPSDAGYVGILPETIGG